MEVTTDLEALLAWTPGADHFETWTQRGPEYFGGGHHSALSSGPRKVAKGAGSMRMIYVARLESLSERMGGHDLRRETSMCW